MYIILLIITLVLSFTWPFQSIDHRIHRGYGDFNGIAGFHPGIDVYSPSDSVLVGTPYPNAYVWKTIQNPENGEWVLLLTASIPETMGLMYQHLLPENSAEPFFETQILGNTVGTCYNPSGVGAVRHVHIANFLKADWPAQGMPPQAGYSDVLADFSIPVHYASFAPVLQASDSLSGIGFWPEGVPLALDILRGAVDFRIAARSANSESSSVDSTGVRKLEINSISRENPLTEEYTPSEYYSPRTVFDWSLELEPNALEGEPLDEYLCLYQDFMGGTIFDYSYICTNTSNLDPGTQGIDNIWTEPYDSQADYDYSLNNPEIRCRGAWDTILKKVWTATDQSACENSDACFPDGKYLVDVTATSHTGNTAPISLPVDNVTLPDPTPVGIVVDNFVPHVDQVIFYTTYPDGEFHLLYHGDWTSVSETERTLTNKPAGYLPYGMGILPQGYLGMAVRFSEPMDPDELPAVWVEGKWADEVQWSSQDNKYHWFYPASIDPAIPSGVLNPSPASDNTGHWVFYKSSGYNDPGYVGALTINVGVQTSVPGTGHGLDLAGNQLDPDPSTIESPLASHSYSTRPLTIPDCSYSWGDSPGYSVIGSMTLWGQTNLSGFRVAINPSLAEVKCFRGFRGDCPWQHGFWVYAIDYELFSPDPKEVISSVVNPDETYSSAVVETMFGNTNDQISFTDYSPMICESGDYLWFSVHSVDRDFDPLTPYGSEDWEHIYCVSRDMSVAISELVIHGFSYPHDDGFRSNSTRITNMEFIDNLTLQIDYWVATGPSSGPPDNGYYGQQIITVPDPNAMSTFEPLENSVSLLAEDIIATQQEYLLSLALSQNPITGTAALNFSTPATGHATVQVFDLSGRTVDTLVNEEVAAGNHSVSWTPENISSGVYFVRLTTAAGTVSTQAMVLR